MRWRRRRPPLPTFLIIGAQKCATRWLRLNLGKHPDVFTAPRELEFFDYRRRYLTRGPKGYRKMFEGWDGEPHVGESTPGYMMPRHGPSTVARRIQETVPDVRLIAIVRNPVDRAHSAMVHHIKRGRLPADTNLVEFARNQPPDEEWMGLIAGGRYAASLKPYDKIFGDQLLVLLHDDIQTDPKGIYSRAVSHIGADTDFAPAGLEDVVFSNRDRATDLSIEERRELYEYFRADIAKLEKLLDRDLSMWRPPGSPVHVNRTLGEAWEWRLERSAAWVEERLLGLVPDDADRPTSQGRSVSDEIDMLVVTTLRYGAMLRDSERAWDEPVDVESEEPVAAYRGAVQQFRDAVDESEERPEPVDGDVGRIRALAVLGVVNQLAHGWEIAAATGQDSEIPEELVESAEDFVRRLLAGMPGAGGGFGFDEAVDVDESATLTERFVALLGRDPGFYRDSAEVS